MQTQNLSIVDSPSQHLLENRSGDTFNLPVIHTEHCAPTADAAFERCAGRAMQSLSLPRPTSLPSTPFGRYQDSGSSLAKFTHHSSPGRPEQHSYPSPPMSDSHSPARRSAHIVEPEGLTYPPPMLETRRLERLTPHSTPPSMLDPRSATVAHGLVQQRPVYPGDPQSRAPAMHYQPSPYGNVHSSQNYVHNYSHQNLTPYLGSQGSGPGAQLQSAAVIAPQPLRTYKPARRTKAHVASACVNCKKAHLSCDVQRPCGRCVASGKQDTCKDVQHKKRGRPRLRDDKEFGRSGDAGVASTQVMGTVNQSLSNTSVQPPSFTTLSRTPESYPMLASMREEDGKRPVVMTTPPMHASLSGPAAPVYSLTSSPAYQSLPVAFLDLDLAIQKSNQIFQELVGSVGEVRNQNLSELLEVRQHDLLQQLRNELRVERDEREPTYMAPITPVGQDPMQPAMQSVSIKDVDQVSNGFSDRSVLLSFRLPNGQFQSFQTQLRLAKTSLYFVTMVVHTPPRPTAQHLGKQLASPAQIRSPQPISAAVKASTKEFSAYSLRPSSSTGSTPSSPYYNPSTVRTSLPPVSSSSFGGSPSYGYSPTAGPEQSYFPTYPPPSQPGGYTSSYTPTSRSNSVVSEAHRASARPPRLDGLQLPPIRTTPVAPLGSPLAQDFGEKDRVRRRPSPPSAGASSDTPDLGKRRRLNIHEVLE